ncbi:DUF2242 domain-containing protein [Roseateles sp. DAIF2]|uniref:DUF2242 domain-containing protein n=1 Tax=Roseateles sp. DAIF2 TaxID=2714952 RepID=UPI0018A30C3D|nr:DUF2242 domain-containing protein [Roseateles sp. DAIF2]QPF71507.1 DUF2242 domain-containing protein [Roseateles sp. DAIF2]
MPTKTTTPLRRSAACLIGLLSALALAGCAVLDSAAGSRPRKPVYQNERFQADETFSRLFDASLDETCEAARRALLSQGYVISQAGGGLVNGSKRFQPEGEVHVEISFNIVCVPDGRGEQLSTAYVSAQQDRYVLKKNPNSTSIGVSAIGSISMPLSSTQDSLVKVASETIPAGEFYDRFFALMQRLVLEQNADRTAAAAATASR